MNPHACAHEALEVERTGDLIELRCRHCGACIGRSAPGLGYQTDRNWRAPFKLLASSGKPSVLSA